MAEPILLTDHSRVNCSIDGCSRPVVARTWCALHYERWRVYGSELWEPVPPELVFWFKTDMSGGEDACWPWLASVNNKGYGKFCIDSVEMIASRAAYVFAIGPIPDGLWVLHSCDNPPCVNPRHFFLGNCQANVDDMMAKGRFHPRTHDIRWTATHCPQGHPYNAQNTLYNTRKTRICSICNAARCLRWRLTKQSHQGVTAS